MAVMLWSASGMSGPAKAWNTWINSGHTVKVDTASVCPDALGQSERVVEENLMLARLRSAPGGGRPGCRRRGARPAHCGHRRSPR